MNASSKSRLHRLSGGLVLPSAHPLNLQGKLITLALPDRLFLPLLDYWQHPIEPVVGPGDTVLTGQALASGLISPASGTVESISPHPSAHPSQLAVAHVVIRPDGVDTPAPDLHSPPDEPDIAWLERCALSGLGGAGFPLAHKLRSWRGGALPLLIINAAECEPGVASDETLMCADPVGIVKGVSRLVAMLHAVRCVIAIEEDMPEALSRLRTALHDASSLAAAPALDERTAGRPGTPPTDSAGRDHALRGHTEQGRIELVVLPARYPAGAEAPLIQQIVGHRPAPGQRPADMGVLCVNVSTAHAVYRACRGYPPISRLITINGPGAPCPGVYRVRHGTRVRDLLAASGNALDTLAQPTEGSGSGSGTSRIRHGGPLSGFSLTDPDTPVGPSTHCLWIDTPAPTSRPSIQPCIRCGRCAEVCPIELLPQQLHAHAIHGHLGKSRHFGIDRCITCGCCDLVCPSHIPLTAQFRDTGRAIAAQDRQRALADQAEARFLAHERRKRAREAQRLQQREQRRQATTGQDPIKAALERARRRKARATGIEAGSKPDCDAS